METVVRQRKNKAVNRGRRDKRGTAEIEEEAGGFNQDAEMVNDTSVCAEASPLRFCALLATP